MSFPDVGRYYNTIILARLVEWANINTKKRLEKMEDTLFGTQLNKIIWIPPKYRALKKMHTK